MLVIGIGLSGRAVAEYFLKRGDLVVGVDRIPKVEVFPVYSEDHEFEVFDFDLVVVSPGVPIEHGLVQRALDEGVEVTGEAELGLKLMKGPVVGITGSNGKSTQVAMIAHVLNQAGREAKALGNIGVPLISEIDFQGIVIAELSSFQLERMSAKVFDLAIILNLSPNHLDRHGTMENYYAAKNRIGVCLKEGGIFLNGVDLKWDLLEFVKFTCKYFGLTDEEISAGIKTFTSLPHRLEFIREIKGVRCYNDSKATTMEAVSYAVRKLEKNVILIAGGRHKGGSFSVWNESFVGIVKVLILLGEAKEIIAKELSLQIPIYFVETLEEAIEKGLQVARQGDNLILSPGCSSYDMFLNYEKRGEAYKRGLESESKRYDPDFSAC